MAAAAVSGDFNRERLGGIQRTITEAVLNYFNQLQEPPGSPDREQLVGMLERIKRQKEEKRGDDL